MKWWKVPFLTVILALGAAMASTTLIVATVNNPDMIRMQELTSVFEEQYDISVQWVVLPEDDLRSRVTTDIATGAGSFDVVTIGTYEVPMWGAQDWLVALDNLDEDYDVEDLLEPVRDGLSHDGTLYALPFYAESSMTFYRADLFEEAGLSMPEEPSWDEVREFAATLHDPDGGTYGICLRGLAGWGLNMGFFNTHVNTFGGRWFDMDWEPQTETPEWEAATESYLDLVNNYGPPGVTSNGFVENLALFADGRCAMWVDATIAGSFLIDPSESQVHDQVGFARAPVAETPRGSHWLWSWSLAIPQTSTNVEEAMTFIQWATSKEYIELVGEEKGWEVAPQGTRYSTYERSEYQEAVPFADLVVDLIGEAHFTEPAEEPVPYMGIQFLNIPEWMAIGDEVGRHLAAAVVGDISVEEFLAQASSTAERILTDAGYYD